MSEVPLYLLPADKMEPAAMSESENRLYLKVNSPPKTATYRLLLLIKTTR
jgi:hypothetical protein